MDSDTKLYLQRAQNELKLAEIVMQISINKDIQTKISEIDKPDTFFSSVITHSYYSIFYSAKSYLIMKGIITKTPEEHKKTYEEFKKLVSQGIVDGELLKLYEEVIIKAEKLLGILKLKKRKEENLLTKELLKQILSRRRKV